MVNNFLIFDIRGRVKGREICWQNMGNSEILAISSIQNLVITKSFLLKKNYVKNYVKILLIKSKVS